MEEKEKEKEHYRKQLEEKDELIEKLRNEHDSKSAQEKKRVKRLQQSSSAFQNRQTQFKRLMSVKNM